MLSQLGLNLEGQGLPTGTNCWMWELDPVEGTAGWSPGEPLPGNLNMAYSTEMLGPVIWMIFSFAFSSCLEDCVVHSGVKYVCP